MHPTDLAEIGDTGVNVTRLGLGGGGLGGLFEVVTQETAEHTVAQALDSGVRYFDTAPLYGMGQSERFMGEGLRGVSRDEFVLSTKVGSKLEVAENGGTVSLFADLPPVKTVQDSSRDGVLRSLDESLDRLGLDRIDIVFIHDPADEKAISEAFPTLAELRDQEVIKAVGVGAEELETIVRFDQVGDLDCVLLPGRYTLLEQSGLDELLPLCNEKGISVIIRRPLQQRNLSLGSSGRRDLRLRSYAARCPRQGEADRRCM